MDFYIFTRVFDVFHKYETASRIHFPGNTNGHRRVAVPGPYYGGEQWIDKVGDMAPTHIRVLFRDLVSEQEVHRYWTRPHTTPEDRQV